MTRVTTKIGRVKSVAKENYFSRKGPENPTFPEGKGKGTTNFSLIMSS
jgi:hypothetical protein